MTGPGDSSPVDVVVVGAGVVGTAVARELAHHPLRVVLVDAERDVGAGTSKANTAILHTGYDTVPGSLESRLVRRGYELLSAYAAETGIAVEPVGALLVAWDPEQEAALPALAAKAAANGYVECAPVAGAELRRLEPGLGEGARAALAIPGEHVIDPWSPSLAFATQAVAAGVELRLSERVVSVSPERGGHVLTTTRGRLATRWLVNAAGLGSGALDGLLGFDRFHVTPRRGELIVFDKLARERVGRILLPAPTSRGKGVLVSPTVFGNVLLGPTADDVDDPRATGTTADGLARLLDHGARILPGLVGEEVTATYAGLRAATEDADYRVFVEPSLHYLCLGGIRSTGLTASLALAEHALELLVGAGLDPGPRRPLSAISLPPLGERQLRPYRDAARIAEDPAYGEIVCHCERVTRGEIRDALASRVPPVDLDGLRRRTRAVLGRCGGFFCGARVRRLLEEGA